MVKNMTKHKKLSVFFLYLIIIALAHGPVLFLARSLAPPLLQPHGVVAGWPEGYEGRTPVNRFNMDMATPAYGEWPINRFVGKSYQNREIPLWNPYQAAGTPLAARYSSRALFPYQILEDISPAKYWDFFLLGRLLIAGFFSFIFLRHLGLSYTPAFFSGALYMLSGSSIWFINLESFANTSMMLPVLMWATERLVTRRSSWEVPISALTLALTILAGEPKMAIYIIILATLYFILRSAQLYNEARTLRNIKRFAIASLLSVALAAPLLLPFAELMQNSVNINPPGGPTSTNSVEKIEIEPSASILVPTAHGFTQNPSLLPSIPLAQGSTPVGEEFFFRALPADGAWDHLGGYTGTTALYLVIAGLLCLPFARKNPNTVPLLFFAGFGVLVLFINLGLGPLAQLERLPFFDCFWSSRSTGPIWTFSLAVAVGLAFETIRHAFDPDKRVAMAEAETTEILYETEEPKKVSFGPASMLVPIAALVLSFASLLYFVPTDAIILFIKTVRTDDLIRTLGPSLVLGTLLSIILLIATAFIAIMYIRKGRALEALIPLALIELWWAIPRGYDSGWSYLKCVPLVLGFYIAVQFYKGRRKNAALTVLLLFASVLLIDHYSPKGLPDRYDTFAPAPYVEFLKEQAPEERVAAGHGILYPNFASALGINDIRYADSLATDTFREYRERYLQPVYARDKGPSSHWFTGRPEVRVGSKEQPILYGHGIEQDIIEQLPYYSLLSMRYIILPSTIDMNRVAQLTKRTSKAPLEFERVYSDSDVSIYENSAALPRAYVTGEVEIAKGYKEAQEKAGADRFADGTSAVIEHDPPATFSFHDPGTVNTPVTPSTHDIPAPPEIDGNAGIIGSVDINTNADTMGSTDTLDTPKKTGIPVFPSATESTEDIKTAATAIEQKRATILLQKNNSVRVEATGPGLLVLTDTFYPGWSAKIDSEKAEIYRVNGIVRGVFISSGTHIIDFKYRPLSFIAGIILSAIALISSFWYGFRCEKRSEKERITDENREA